MTRQAAATSGARELCRLVAVGGGVEHLVDAVVAVDVAVENAIALDATSAGDALRVGVGALKLCAGMARLEDRGLVAFVDNLNLWRGLLLGLCFLTAFKCTLKHMRSSLEILGEVVRLVFRTRFKVLRTSLLERAETERSLRRVEQRFLIF